MSQPILFDKENIHDSLGEINLHEESTRNQAHPPRRLINANIKKFLIHRFGFTSKDFLEDVPDDEMELSTPILPLEIENGLTTASALRAFNISMMILRILKFDSKRASGVYQASMQLIVHLTRAPEVIFYASSFSNLF